MKIPKKISPDRIKDAIIEVRYTSSLPYELLLGIFFKSLDDTYTYTNRPVGKHQYATSLAVVNLPQEITYSLGRQNLFHNDKIKIQLQPNSIIFNCLNEYILWDNYKIEIEKVLTTLHETKLINHYNRIGVRYISEYPNFDLQDGIKFAFTFGMPSIQSQSYQFRSEFTWDKVRVILNLSNKMPISNNKDDSSELSVANVSLIDIDVILDGFIEIELKGLMEKMSEAQFKEKSVFFNLLKEDFLQTLNPEY